MKATTTEDVTRQLRNGKANLRRSRRSMSLDEKLAELVELQKLEIAMIRRRRELRPSERVWAITPAPRTR